MPSGRVPEVGMPRRLALAFRLVCSFCSRDFSSVTRAARWVGSVRLWDWERRWAMVAFGVMGVRLALGLALGEGGEVGWPVMVGLSW